MSSSLRISLAQLNYKVGDLAGNFNKIKNVVTQGNANLYLFSELALTGYPPEDLLLFPNFLDDTFHYLSQVESLSKKYNVAIAVGAPYQNNGQLYNAVYIFADGETVKIISKKHLPNYGVFDEKRYFQSGKGAEIVHIYNYKIKFYICEDLWQDDSCNEDVDLLISLNASPFEIGKKKRRYEIACRIVDNYKVPLIYLNQIGGQDSLVFDGESFALSETKQISYLDSFVETVTHYNKGAIFRDSCDSELADIYNALILGLRDYVNKNNFKDVLIGLSGGIDSAFCAVLACDALGSERVNLIKLPSEYTSTQSFVDADYFIDKSGCKDLTIKISDLTHLMEEKLSDIFAGYESDITEENIQSRMRGNILMALSNKLSKMLITTGNKSEYATGYATLYGDMCGGFAPIKDVYKTDLYKLANYRNANIPSLSIFKQENVFNNSVLTKEPTAELKAEQKDSDNLPEYEVLDAILKLIIEERKSGDEIVKLGYDKIDVTRVAKLLKNSEYKRFQAAPGVKINKNSFTRDWRLPLTNGYLF